jgi:hypothetical protein
VVGAEKVKVLDLVDRCGMSITIVGVQYLYPRLDYESWLIKTGYELGKEDKNFQNYDNFGPQYFLSIKSDTSSRSMPR